MTKKSKELAIHEKDTGSSEVQIAQLTDRNQHNDSVKMLAQMLGRKPEAKIMDHIAAIHKIEGHMYPSLITYRTDVMKKLLKFNKFYEYYKNDLLFS